MTSFKTKATELSTDELYDLLLECGSVSAITRSITNGKQNAGVSAIIAQRIKDSGFDHMRYKNMSRLYTKDDVVSAFKHANCWSDVFRSLGLSVCGHNKTGIIAFSDRHGIDVPVFTKEQLGATYQRNKQHQRLTHDETYCINSTHPRQSLRSRVLKDGVIDEYRCSECNNTGTYNNKPLSLELDHINGVSDDNRLVNLRWLCPNCHSQTLTYKGKNKGR